MFEEKYKDVYIQIRLSEELREKFKAVCKEKNINSSAMIRQLMSRWLTEQTTPNNPHNRGTDL